jgi:hypothetical protein
MMGEISMRRLSRAAGLALSVLLIGGAAKAAPFEPMIDLRDSQWIPGAGVSSYFNSQDGYDLTLESLRFGGGSLVGAGFLAWDDDDGYGIYGVASGYDADEIEASEVLRITFGTSTYVERVLVTDLYLERGYAEQGRYSVNGGGSWTWFQADGQHNNGEIELSVNAWANSILFNAPGRVGTQGHEFSVAGLDLNYGSYDAAAPEPGAALLFGVGLALLRRRAARLRCA